MDILMVTRPIVAPLNEGSKRMVYNLINKIKNINFVVLTTKNHGLDFPKNVTCDLIFSKKDLLISLNEKIRLFKHLLKHDPRILAYHTFFTPNFTNAIFFRLIKLLKNKPIIQSVPTSINNNLFKKFLLYGNVIIVYTKGSKKKLSGFGRVIRIPPGVNLQEFNNSVPNLALKKKLNIINEFVILFPGNYKTSLNCSDIIIKAILKLDKKLKNYKFIFACRLLSAADRREEIRLKRIVNSARLKNKVIFLNVVDNMAELISLSSIVIFPASHMKHKAEIPIILLESMAEGKPIIISDLPLLRETISSRKDLMINPNDVDSLYNKIIYLYKNPKKRLEIGRECTNIVKKHFNINITSKEYAKIYEAINNGSFKGL